MLTRQENHWNFVFLQKLSYYNILPVQVDELKGQITSQNNKRRRYTWIACFVLKLLHSVYVTTRFIYYVAKPIGEWKLNHVSVHFMFVVSFVACYWTYNLFVRYKPESIIIFNELFDGESSGRRRFFKSWGCQYKVDEVLMLSYPIMMCLGVSLVLVVFCSDPCQPFLIYSIIPERFQSWWIFFVLTSLDVYFTIMTMAVFVFCFIVKALFISKCKSRFSSILNRVKNVKDEECTTDFIEGVLKEERHLSVYIQIFNISYNGIIFSFKVAALCLSIIGFSFGIMYKEEHPFAASFAVYDGAVVFLIYGILYKDGYVLEESSRKIKKKLTNILKATAEKYENPNLLHREIRATRSIGLKVGHFHTMKRLAVPLFVNFVASKVMKVIITFR